MRYGLTPPTSANRSCVRARARVLQQAIDSSARVSVNFDQTADQPILARGRGHGERGGVRVEEQREEQKLFQVITVGTHSNVQAPSDVTAAFMMQLHPVKHHLELKMMKVETV